MNSSAGSNNKIKNKNKRQPQRIYFRSLTLPPAKLLPPTSTSLAALSALSALSAVLSPALPSSSPTLPTSPYSSCGGGTDDSFYTAVGTINSEPDNIKSEYSPHFLSALQLIAHVVVPLRKALVHFYMSYRTNTDIENKLEWQTLLAFGRLFKELISSPSASSSSSASILSGNSGAAETESRNSNNSPPIEDTDTVEAEQESRPVSSERFFPIFNKCLIKYTYKTHPEDAAEAIRIVLQTLQNCCRTIPVTNQLWLNLLDKACMGLMVRSNLVGQQRVTKDNNNDNDTILQRTHREKCILWCPHEISILDINRIKQSKQKKDTKTKSSGESGDDDDDDEDNPHPHTVIPVPTLQQLIEIDCEKRPLNTTTRKYHDFNKKNSYDFEVKIPTKFLNNSNNNSSKEEKDNNNEKEEDEDEVEWRTTRSMQFASFTGYLFLSINRRRHQDGKNKNNRNKLFDHSELVIPPTLDLSKLSSNDNNIKTTAAAGGGGTGTSKNNASSIIYELVGGALFDEGDYVAVLKDLAIEPKSSLAKDSSDDNKNDDKEEDDDNDDNDNDEEEEEETWKLMEPEEVIPMSESDILEFLKGEGNNDDDDGDDKNDDENENGDSDGNGDSESDDDDYGPCGTIAVYKLKVTTSSSSSSSSNKNDTIFDEMNQLLSDIVISQVSGDCILDSKTDYYTEEEYYEEEIID